MDSINVLVRAHYLPLFSRLGPYPSGLLDDMAYRRRELFEYWAHEASLIPVEMQPLFRWQMDRADVNAWGSMRRIAKERPGYVERVLAEIADRGPLAASEMSDPGRSSGPWWGWADAKSALEWLFWSGRVGAAGRRNFERLYDLTERVLPSDVLEAPTPSVGEAQRALIRRASLALGVATARDLADYFRIPPREARLRIQELVDEGSLEPVEVRGWGRTAYTPERVRLPRDLRAQALVGPFDSLMWYRERVERTFGFRYRIEVYTPAAKRQYGYYVVPLLLGDRLVARLDLKADRKASALLVRGSFLEPECDALPTAAAAAQELRSLGDWLELDRVEVADRGNLAHPLQRALR